MEMKLDALAELMKEAPSQQEPEDLNGKQEKNTASDSEQVVWLPISQLMPFPRSRYNRYQEYSGERMSELIESIQVQGILQPLIVRRYNGAYQIVSGHNRKKAAERLGWLEIPCLIRSMSDEEALWQLNEINVQQRELLPSQKAFAYKIKIEYLRQKKNVRQIGADENNDQKIRIRADEQLAQISEDSARQIQRYIRLTELTDDLLDAVDAGLLGLDPAGKLAQLRTESQNVIFSSCFCREDGALRKIEKFAIKERGIRKLVEIDSARALVAQDVARAFEKVDKSVPPRMYKVPIQKLSKKYPQLMEKNEKEVGEIVEKALALYFNQTGSR